MWLTLIAVASDPAAHPDNVSMQVPQICSSCDGYTWNLGLLRDATGGVGDLCMRAAATAMGTHVFLLLREETQWVGWRTRWVGWRS